jgi:hypothetical protein
MACLQVSDGGDGFQIWRVSVNILNKQSQTTDGVVLQLGAWVWGSQLPTIKISLLQNVTKGLRPVWILWINDLS